MADLQTLQNAFMKAHTAGDTANAQVLATEIKRQMAAPQQDAAPAAPAAAAPAPYAAEKEAYKNTPFGNVIRAGEHLYQGDMPGVKAALGDEIGADNAAVRGAANTITLGGADHLAALGDKMAGFAPDQATALRGQRGLDKQAEKDYPSDYTGGEVGGALMAPETGLVKDAGLAKGLVEGTFQGGVSGFNNTEGGWGQKLLGGLRGAIYGTAGGAAGPVLAKAGGMVRNVSDLFLDPSGKDYALRKISEAAQKGKTDIPSAVQGVADAHVTTPDWVMADQLGNPGARLTGAVIRNGSEGGEALRQDLTTRQMGSGDRVKGIFSDVFGDPAKYHGTMDDAVQGMKTKAKPFYAAAENTPIDYTAHPELQDFLKRVPPQVLSKANDLMNIEGKTSKQILLKQNPDGSFDQSTLPDMKQWDYIKQGMDTLINGADGKGASGGLTPQGYLVNNLKKEILGSLDTAVPDYAKARGIFKGDAEVKNALESGRGALAADPEAITKTLTGMSDAEKAAHGIGLSRALGDKVDKTKMTGDTLANVWNTPAMKAKIGAGVDDPFAFNNLGNQLDREGAMSRTFQKFNGNSATAERLKDGEDMAQSGAADFGTRLFTRGIWNALYGAGTHMARKIGGLTDTRADQIAKDLGSDGSDLLTRYESSADREAKLAALSKAFSEGGSKIGRAAVLTGQNR